MGQSNTNRQLYHNYPVLLSINMPPNPEDEVTDAAAAATTEETKTEETTEAAEAVAAEPEAKEEEAVEEKKKRRKQKNKVSQILSSIHKSTNQIQKMVFLLYSTIQSYWKNENISFPFKHEETLPYLIR